MHKIKPITDYILKEPLPENRSDVYIDGEYTASFKRSNSARKFLYEHFKATQHHYFWHHAFAKLSLKLIKDQSELAYIIMEPKYSVWKKEQL